MRLGTSMVLNLLIVIPFLILFLRVTGRRRHEALERFGDSNLVLKLIANFSPERRRTKLALIVIAIALGIVALARPQFGETRQDVKRSGIDIIVALDTSKSMLAEDIKPNRLSAAKRNTRGLIRRLEGDRVGIIAFAGTSFVLCPLTLDYGAAEMILEEMDTDIVSMPGTNLEDAIQKARQSFVKGEQKYRVLVLITDGQATVGDPLKAAEEAFQEGIRIFCIGLGQPSGIPIPVRDEKGNLKEYKKDSRGELVEATLDEETLMQIVSVSDGVYYRATSSLDELDAIYDEVRAMEEKELKSQMYVQHIERFQWVLFPMLLLLGIEYLMPSVRRLVKNG